ncbi:MAG: von Willebrand factor type A domain-containing protein [Chitinophagaceae bacterium]
MPLCAQYYLRGEVKDEKGQLLSNVKIYLHSKGTLPFSSGNSGNFGIPTTLLIDTITLIKEGYEKLRLAVNTKQPQTFVMKLSQTNSSLQKNKLSSVTKNLFRDKQFKFFTGEESYNTTIDNDFVPTAQYPETGFSLTVDRAAYSNIRRFINLGYQVPPDAVRIEEMLNYFALNDAPSHQTNTFTPATQVTTCPWNPNSKLLLLTLEAPKIDASAVPPSNLVFLIDVSGSMDKPNRLPLVQSALKLMVRNLRIQDTVSIVVYGGTIGVFMQPTSGDQKDKIIAAIDRLQASGDTPGEGAIRMAYQLARNTFIPNGNNRVILATDGDFNVGQTSEKELEELIVSQRGFGIYLTCLGVGMGNYKDSKLETLAKKGNGNFAYLDHLKEAEKVLVTEFTKTLYAVANDAYLTVNFNPEYISSYRLIGFGNKEEAATDSTSELEGGEVGTGHIITAVFEITPTTAFNDNNNSIIANWQLQYKLPNSNKVQQLQFASTSNTIPIAQAPQPLQLATTLVMFGEMLKQSKFVRDVLTWDQLINMAQQSLDQSNALQVELLQLIQKAAKIYGYKKRIKSR